MWKEFRDFAVKGNMIDLAVGIIIGGAFGKVISSLVSDVLMPPIGLLLGKVNFSVVPLQDLKIVLVLKTWGTEPTSIFLVATI